MSSVNPFDSDKETPSATLSRKEKKPAKKASSKSTKGYSSRSKKTPVLLQSSDSDSDEPRAPISPLKRKKTIAAFLDSEEERDQCQEPIRASALRSYLSRRVGSGYTVQRDPTRAGEYFEELRVYNAREAETLPKDRWKRALVTYKSALNDTSASWKAVTKLVAAAKEDYSSIQPILYPSNVF